MKLFKCNPKEHYIYIFLFLIVLIFLVATQIFPAGKLANNDFGWMDAFYIKYKALLWGLQYLRLAMIIFTLNILGGGAIEPCDAKLVPVFLPK